MLVLRVSETIVLLPILILILAAAAYTRAADDCNNISIFRYIAYHTRMIAAAAAATRCTCSLNLKLATLMFWCMLARQQGSRFQMGFTIDRNEPTVTAVSALLLKYGASCVCWGCLNLALQFRGLHLSLLRYRCCCTSAVVTGVLPGAWGSFFF